MTDTLMILPARTTGAIRLIRIPEDFEPQEAYRLVTGLIAAAEEQNPDCDWEDIQSILEEHDIETLEFILGPKLDQE